MLFWGGFVSIFPGGVHLRAFYLLLCVGILSTKDIRLDKAVIKSDLCSAAVLV